MPATRIPLTSGAYTARNVIASAQRSRNLYIEKNPPGEDSPTTHLLTPGLSRLGLPPEHSRVRGLYPATNGKLYAAIGANLYYVASDWTFTLLGEIGSGGTPVSMGDNGTTMVVVDGTATGWSVVLASNAFAVISDPNFYGSNFVESLDTYLLFNKPNTAIFYSSDSNAITFDPLWFAAKSGYSDLLAGIAIRNRLIWLIGAQASSEIWTNVGAADFPFQLFSGPFIEHGTIATYSIAKYGGAVFWLGTDQAGASFVLKGENLKAEKVSNPGIEWLLSQVPTLTDAVGFTYEQQGHAFYWLKLPSANAGLGLDLVYDITTGEWHERGWLNPATCNQEAHRVYCSAFCYGVNVGGDRDNGQLYLLDLNNQTDNGVFIERRRGWPHIMANGDRVSFPSFVADMQAGTATTTSTNVAYWTNPTLSNMVTVIDTTFTAPNGTLLQNYFLPYGVNEPGSQYTQIISGTNAEIEGDVLTGASSGEAAYVASGQPTSPNYVAQFQAIPSDYSGVAPAAAEVYLVGRADTSGVGYKAAVIGGDAQYYVTLFVGAAVSGSVGIGTLASGHYEVLLSMQDTAIGVAVQRSTDSLWVAPDSTWQADFVACISITDGTYTTAGRVVIGGVW